MNKLYFDYNYIFNNAKLKVKARILPTPTIEYHPSSRGPRFEPEKGVWNLRDKKVATGATLGSWSVLAFLEKKDDPSEHAIRASVTELVNTCQATGMVNKMI